MPSHAHPTLAKMNQDFVRVLFATLRLTEAMAPTVASRLALHTLFTPPRFKGEAIGSGVPTSQRGWCRSLSGKQCAVYRWGEDGPTILLVHGWGVKASAMAHFVPPLLERGFRVVAFDLPAHGASQGFQTEFMEVAGTLMGVLEAPPYAVIGHSGGAFATVIAQARFGLGARKLVLLAPLRGAMWMSDQFAQMSGLSDTVIQAMRKHLERRYANAWAWEDFDTVRLVEELDCPLLVGHGKNDRVVDPQHSHHMAAAAPNADLDIIEDTGHVGILRSAHMVKRTAEFLGRGSDVVSSPNLYANGTDTTKFADWEQRWGYSHRAGSSWSFLYAARSVARWVSGA